MVARHAPAPSYRSRNVILRVPGSGPISVTTPLEPGRLVFASMTGTEALGEPFDYALDLLGDDPNLETQQLLGKTMAVRLELPGAELRHFHGHIASIELVDAGDRPKYRVVLRPWLWLLSNTKSCRIFQNKTIPEIVEDVFREHGFSDFERSLHEEYPPVDYVVQYRESDFDFVSRLLEQAGIYYYFRHGDSAHTLVVVDSPWAHKPAPSCKDLAYRPPDTHRDRLLQYIDRWQLSQRLAPGAVTLHDFDFRKPRCDLSAKLSSPRPGARARFEVFDYPGGFASWSDGDARARLRLEQEQDGAEVALGHTNARGVSVGSVFELEDHPRRDQNRKYLVRWTQITLAGSPLQTGTAVPEAPTFSCDFAVSPEDVPFRPKPKTPKPVVQGPETAVIVGPPGQEIWTDEFGRVKVQFHWDRFGNRDQNSSCWVRVAQLSAGTNWGAMFIPRVDQEVIVDFLGGDPDRPIITGRVYNGCNMPPYDLPANQTQSGIKTRSTKGGTPVNGNEIRFEDMKGYEDLFIGAERTQTTVVKGDQTATVGGSRALTVAGAESVTVGTVRTVQVAGDSFAATDANKTERVGGSLTTLVGGLRVETLSSNSVTDVAKDSLTHVGGLTRFDLDGALHVTTRGDETRTVGGKLETRIGGPASHVHATDVKTVVGHPERQAAMSTFVYGHSSTTASEDYVLRSDTSIVLQCGDTKVVITPDGVTVNGKTLAFRAGAKLTATSPSATLGMDDNVAIVGKQVTISSTSAQLALDSVAKLTGSKVQLGQGSGSNASTVAKDQQDDREAKPVFLRTKIIRRGKPAAKVPYRIVLDGRTDLTGSTGPDGKVERQIPGTATTAELTLLDTGDRRTFTFGSVDSIDTVLGVQHRLQRLGYYHGLIDGVGGLVTAHAIASFQRAQGLNASGTVNAETADALQKAHGS